jgi:prenyltransferase beta subunit
MTRLQDELSIECVGMETFGAGPAPPKDHCLEQVRRSSLYVGVFGARYGYVDEHTGLSATELEYREAIRLGLPCLIYVIDPNAPVTVMLKDVDTGIGALKLEALKSAVRDFSKGHMVSSFSSENDLATRLSVDLIRAVNMIRAGNGEGDLKATVEAAIADGVAFICDMENRTAGGWSYHQMGISNAWDTAYSLLALVASGRAGITAQLHRGHHFLLSSRYRFGGWRSSWENSPDASTTIDTALAISALIESGYEEQPWEISRSADYLAAAQQPCGGWSYTFGVGDAATAATAWAVTALIKAGWSPSTDVVQRACHWLSEGQRFDGGWGADRKSDFSTIGKTRDALMAFAVSRSPEAQGALENAKRWLLGAREAFSSSEDFAKKIGIEPQGINPVVENIVLFLEGAFFANIPPREPAVKKDLAWLSSRRFWSNTARAISCLCYYRQWLT